MNIEALAREAGLVNDDGRWFSPTGDPLTSQDVATDNLTRFARLVLEEAARACDSIAQAREDQGTWLWEGRKCATAIRGLVKEAQ